jgi:Flp pilus assembly protein TadB
MLFIFSLFFGTGCGVGIYGLVKLVLERGTRSRWEPPLERGWLLKSAHAIGERGIAFFPPLERRCREKYDMLLKQCGLYPVVEGEALFGFTVMGAGAGALLATALFPDKGVNALGVGIILGAYSPFFYFRSRRKEWQAELSRGFPYALDLLTLSVEGGLDFTGALRELTQSLDPSPVYHECATILQDIDLGKTRADALKSFGSRATAPEIKSVVLGITQSLEMGGGVADTLRQQSKQMRFSRLMNAEEAAQKAPTKMMIPMVLFILPCIFIVIFAPIVVSLISTFRGGF